MIVKQAKDSKNGKGKKTKKKAEDLFQEGGLVEEIKPRRKRRKETQEVEENKDNSAEESFLMKDTDKEESFDEFSLGFDEETDGASKLMDSFQYEDVSTAVEINNDIVENIGYEGANTDDEINNDFNYEGISKQDNSVCKTFDNSNKKILKSLKRSAENLCRLGELDNPEQNLKYVCYADKVKSPKMLSNGALALYPYKVYVNNQLAAWDKIFEVRLKKRDTVIVEFGISFDLPDGCRLQVCAFKDLKQKFGCHLIEDYRMYEPKMLKVPLMASLEVISSTAYLTAYQPIIQAFIIQSNKENEKSGNNFEDSTAEDYKDKEDIQRKVPDILKEW